MPSLPHIRAAQARALALAALTLAACALAAAPVPSHAETAGTAAPRPAVVTGARDAREVESVRDALGVLELWLDHESAYAPASRPLVRVALVDSGHVVSHAGHRSRIGGTMRGAYDPRTATIYLVRPWFGTSPQDRGVLLHELVHHRQVGAKHWYCERAMEWDAYRLQDAWLADHGLDSGFHWAAILLGSSCAVRDHHPD